MESSQSKAEYYEARLRECESLVVKLRSHLDAVRHELDVTFGGAEPMRAQDPKYRVGSKRKSTHWTVRGCDVKRIYDALLGNQHG